MRRISLVHIRAGAALVCCVGAFVLASPKFASATTAGFKTSAHDFTPTGSYPISPQPTAGACSFCHIPHKASSRGWIWKRSLEGEAIYYDQGRLGDPNYIPGAALQCYDCHDSETTYEAADPPMSVWNALHKPQDTAEAGALVGYYETACGQRPGGANPAPTDGSPTGGHYWKDEPSNNPDYKKGDKIPCSLCHDPHNTATGTNEAFFRTTTWDGLTMKALNDFNSYGTDLKASTYNAVTQPTGSRNGTGTGRAMCAICHGYSDQGNQAVLYNVTVPKPPAPVIGNVVPLAVPEHVRDDSIGATPCIACHGHNQIYGCNDCHAYPPLLTVAEGGGTFDRTHATRKYVESYAGGAGAHRRHMEALGSAIFKCEICHGPNPGRPGTAWHNQSSGSTCGTVTQANVDIMGMTSYWGAGSSYNGVSSGGFTDPSSGAVFAFAAKGGPDGANGGRCANLTCHGNPPNVAGALNWTDKLVDPVTGNPVGDGLSICKWCHDATPAKIGTGPAAPNVLGADNGATGVWNTGTWGADVSGHGKAAGNYDDKVLNDGAGKVAANKSCTVCHDARYTNLPLPSANTPIKPHFVPANNDEKRLKGTNGTTINGIATADADAACNACHQVTPGAGDSGTQVATHGNAYIGFIETPAFTRSCRQCHDVHGANWNNTGAIPRNLHMVGKWQDSFIAGTPGVPEAGEEARVDSNAASATADITSLDNRVLFNATTGAGSYDAGNNEGFIPPRGICVVCHVSLVNNHSQVGDSVARGSGHNPAGGDCRQCHNHDYDKNPLTADAFAPSGCNGCHGTNATEVLQNDPNAGNIPALRGQFWPDGVAVLAQYTYADNQTGAHRKHVESIAQQMYGEAAAQVVLDYSPANPLLTSAEKQKAICAFCHLDPGGPGHSTNVATDPLVDRANVYGGTAAGDWLRKYVPNAGSRAAYADDTTAGSGYNFTTESCANLVCHNQAATPVAPTGWNTPPPWTASATCSATTCHATGTYTNTHTTHVGAAQKNYACTECHADNATLVPVTNPVPLGHGNGEVDMVWNNAGSLEFVKGGGNGFYDKQPGGVASPGDTAFGYKLVPYNVACYLVYCHGGDNAAWGGADITPVWDNSAPDSVYCGSCHDGNGSDAVNPGGLDVIATGNHSAHLNGSYGPRFALPAGIGPGNAAASCLGTATVGCHSNFLLTTPSHVNGTTEFANVVTTTVATSALGATAPAGAPDATSTDRCNRCHSTASVTLNTVGTVVGTVLAKTPANWANGVYALPCLSCHNGVAPATVYANGTGGVTAMDMLGTDLPNESGAEIRGHNRPLADGNYPLSNNPPAARTCEGATGCHDAASVHINGSNDTTYAGNRMLATINSIGVTTATGSCNACHATGSSPATKKNVNMHGNTNYAGRLEGAFPGVSGTPSGMECMNCHEPHGKVANGAGYNIYMVPSAILVPGTAAGVTAPGVRFEARSGNYSFNDTQGTDADDLCVVCHYLNGNGMNYNEGGYHAAPAYDNDEQGSDCSGCHVHNRDNNLATVDGLMTVACNSCHTYTPLLTGSVTTPALHRLSASHDRHIGRPSDEAAVPNKAYVCNACHYQSSHNNKGMQVGDAWGVVTSAQVQVRFANPAAVPTPPQSAGPWNTVAAANNPVDRSLDSTSYVGTVCSNLYCHGADPATFPAADAGTDTTPDWTSAATGACGTCHKYTAASPPGTLAHPKHAGNSAAPDPQYSIGCKVCHYTTTTDGTTIVTTGVNLVMASHVNHSVEVAFNAAADTRVDATSTYAGDPAIGSGYGACNFTYCHSNGTDRFAPFDTAGTAAPAVALAWDSVAGSNCWSCHGNGTTNSMPNYTNGTPKANKHPIHNNLPTDTPPGNGYGCQVCHWPTTQTGIAIVSTTLHVNRSYEADDDNAGSTLDAFTYVPASGSCDTANCHGGNSGISWGLAGPITCDICHSYVNGARTATDVNNFTWDNATQSKIGNAAGGQYETAGHGKSGVNVACAGCHDSALPHDQTMIGANPYRLVGYSGNQTTFCNTTCHTVQVRTHDPDEMQAAGIAPKRIPWPSPWNTPTTSPRCVNCHDPHGDATNLAMINSELYDKAPFQINNAATPAAPTEQLNLLFTDNVTGVKSSAPYNSYADSVVFSSICQECHEAANMVSFHDGPSGGTDFGANHPAVGTTDCSDCHRHDAGFAPSGCEGCHNGVQTKFPLAPNVMGNGTLPNGNGGTPKPYDNGTWGYNVNGHGSNGSATNTPKDAFGDPYISGNAACTACHDISTPAGTHLNNVLNSVDQKLNPNANTAHLIPAFLTGAASPDWDVQVKFDDTCYAKTGCHGASMSHRHVGSDLLPVPKASQFGDGGTVLNGESVRYPIDSALTTTASTGGRSYAVCISCHNPHGTNVVEAGKATNRMLRDKWASDTSTLCVECHR